MRELLKQLVNGAASVCMFPTACCYWLAATLGSTETAFPGWSQLVSLLPGTTGVYLRRAFYRWVLPNCGLGSVISFGTVFSHPGVTVGKSAYLGLFNCIGNVDIGDDVLIGSHVAIMNGNKQHGIDRLDIPVREQPGQWPRVTIGRDSWIGDRAVIMCDVGSHCVVGAGAVVTKPVPDFAIVVGVPARIVGRRGEPN